MLQHSRGYYLADRGTDLRTMQDYLGHRDQASVEAKSIIDLLGTRPPTPLLFALPHFFMLHHCLG
jgi:hypothetical protein